MFVLRYWKKFDNASIYVQFGATFIMFFNIFFNLFYPSYEGFSVTVMLELQSMALTQCDTK